MRLISNWRYEKLDDEVEHDNEIRFQRTGQRSRWKVVVYLNIGLLIVSFLALSVSVSILSKSKSANWLLKRVNTYSPLLDQFDISFRQRKVNASLFNDPFSIYKADPSEEGDRAWEEIGRAAVLALTADEVRSMGKDPEWTTGIPEELGKGKDKYFGIVDGQHLIHCLNAVRRFAFYDHYYRPKYGDMSNLPPIIAAHRSHCLGVLLDALTCQPSYNLITFSWMETQKNPFPDFDIWRQCQNHKQLLEWQKEREIKREIIDAHQLRRPSDAKVLPPLPQILALDNWKANGSFPSAWPTQ